VTYRGVGHLALVTTDMEKTTRFYRDVLGMRLVGTTGGDRNSFRHYFFSLGPASAIAFFEWPEVQMPPRKDSGVPGDGRQFDHVAIAVATDDDLLAAQSRLRAAGYETSDLIDHGLCRSLYFEDPNGISIELAVWAQDLDSEPMFADTDPIPAALEEPGHPTKAD
jgi:catechol 2,3-dioxygenase-like lactoylglutathione lyase family enzyme